MSSISSYLEMPSSPILLCVYKQILGKSFAYAITPANVNKARLQQEAEAT